MPIMLPSRRDDLSSIVCDAAVYGEDLVDVGDGRRRLMGLVQSV